MDIAKPSTRRIDEKKGYTFHGHDVVGEKMINKPTLYYVEKIKTNSLLIKK